MLFSQRHGYKPVKEIIQIDKMDIDLRNALWDSLCIHYWRLIEEDHEDLDVLIKIMWHLYFKEPIDTIPEHWGQIYKYIRKYFFECEWYEVYDFIEFIAAKYNPSLSRYSYYERERKNEEYKEFCNNVLERESSGYRFVDEYITKITSEQEIETIEKALKRDGKYKPVRIHLDTALQLLTDKRKPDYRNSIKESISAVEALCKVITNDDKATLGKALTLVEQKYGLHAALKGAFEKLYGYSSDADGIRHALLDESKLGYEDALYILITCSAFINYLLDKNSL
ncbi:MAG: AbiJ-NTD4 domain-containing protein [Tepidanaerobacteraceae bacterium]|jgi:hypothetical protein